MCSDQPGIFEWAPKLNSARTPGLGGLGGLASTLAPVSAACDCPSSKDNTAANIGTLAVVPACVQVLYMYTTHHHCNNNNRSHNSISVFATLSSAANRQV